jgi:hypothetical protein
MTDFYAPSVDALPHLRRHIPFNTTLRELARLMRQHYALDHDIMHHLRELWEINFSTPLKGYPARVRRPLSKSSKLILIGYAMDIDMQELFTLFGSNGLTAKIKYHRNGLIDDLIRQETI